MELIFALAPVTPPPPPPKPAGPASTVPIAAIRHAQVSDMVVKVKLQLI